MADEYVDDGIPFLRSQNVLPFRVSTDRLKFIPRAFHERLHKSALRPRDVVVVRTGYPGTAAVIPQSLVEANCADLVIITPGPELDPDFLAATFQRRRRSQATPSSSAATDTTEDRSYPHGL